MANTQGRIVLLRSVSLQHQNHVCLAVSSPILTVHWIYCTTTGEIRSKWLRSSRVGHTGSAVLAHGQCAQPSCDQQHKPAWDSFRAGLWMELVVSPELKEQAEKKLINVQAYLSTLISLCLQRVNSKRCK